MRLTLTSMRPDDFFLDAPPETLDVRMLEELRAGPLMDWSDLEAAIALATLLEDEFTRFGTDSTQTIDDEGSRQAMRALRGIADRLGIPFGPPFRDFPSFRAYWGTHGGYGSWATRRTMVSETFGPLQEELQRREDGFLRGDLAEPISRRGSTGWSAVDTEIAEMRRHFHAATTPQDYRNVGNDMIAVLEAISAAAYDSARHLRAGEVEPPIARTKDRLSRVVEVDCRLAGGTEMTRLTRAVIELAQAVKHNPAGSRSQAGVAADAVILLANILRRIQEPA
jgi:hypothetical protein